MLRAGSRGRSSVERAEGQQLQQIQQGGDKTAGAIREGLGGAGQARQRLKTAGVEESRFQQQMDMQAADKGLTRDPREQQLEDEMARGAKQTSKSIESTTSGYRKTETQLAGEKQAGEVAVMKAQTAQLNAQTALEKAIGQDTGDDASKDSIKIANKRWFAQMDVQLKTLNDLQNGLVNQDQLQDLFESLKDNPDPALQQAMGLGPEEIESNPELKTRLMEAVKNKMGVAQIMKLRVDGDMTGLDDRLPIMRQHREIRDNIEQFALGNMAFAELSQAGQSLIEDQNPGIQGGSDFSNSYRGFSSRQEVGKFLNQTAAHIFIQRQKIGMGVRKQQKEASSDPTGNESSSSEGVGLSIRPLEKEDL